MKKNVKVSVIVSCFNGSKYLSAFLENCAEQTIKDQTEIVLVHNEPSKEEIKIVKNFQERHQNLINYIIVPKESLAISTNRAIKLARGEYLCIWNVDDLRTSNSLELMVKTIDENQDTVFTYGDYIIVREWKSAEGYLVIAPKFEKKRFIENMHLGPFYMWRKSLCNFIRYWDEQFRSGADFDYAVRLAIESTGEKTEGLLGYYLDEGLGLSTKRATLQPIERTFIELRYGIYHKLDFWYYTRARKYKLQQVLEVGRWVDIDVLVPHRKRFMENRGWMIYAILRYPFWVVQRVINKFKR